jgi:hypothetical protein
MVWAGVAAGAGVIWYAISNKMKLAAQSKQSAMTLPSSPITSLTLSPNGMSVTNLDGTQTVTNSPAHAATILQNHKVMQGMAFRVVGPTA